MVASLSDRQAEKNAPFPLNPKNLHLCQARPRPQASYYASQHPRLKLRNSLYPPVPEGGAGVLHAPPTEYFQLEQTPSETLLLLDGCLGPQRANLFPFLQGNLPLYTVNEGDVLIK